MADSPEKPSAMDGNAETPLHAAAWGGDIDEARSLVAAGADVNHVDSAEETPLHGAAAWGNAEMARYLLSAGARFDIPGATALSPLHWAAGWGNLETVKVLVNAGANLNAQNSYGKTPEEVAIEHRRQDIATYLHERQRRAGLAMPDENEPKTRD